MTVRNAPALLVIGAAQIALGFVYHSFASLLGWSGANFLLIGMAYIWQKPGIFGKRPNGTLTAWRVALLWPYLLFTWVAWYLGSRISREAPGHLIAPGLWLGRRAYGRELPPDVSLIVDLTAELPEPRSVRQGRTYLCLPTLDGSVPDRAKMRMLVETISTWQGGVYVHCALGRGRSALVVAAVLLAKGAAPDFASASRMLKDARPSVRMNAVQRAYMGRWNAPD